MAIRSRVPPRIALPNPAVRRIDPGIVDWEFNPTDMSYANPADHNHILDGVRQLRFG
jgi:hypothetical protein